MSVLYQYPEHHHGEGSFCTQGNPHLGRSFVSFGGASGGEKESGIPDTPSFSRCRHLEMVT